MLLAAALAEAGMDDVCMRVCMYAIFLEASLMMHLAAAIAEAGMCACMYVCICVSMSVCMYVYIYKCL